MDTAGEENADTEPGVCGWEEQTETAQELNEGESAQSKRLTAVVPVADSAGGIAGDRVATRDTHLAGLILDCSDGLGHLFVGGGRCGFARLAASTELVEAEGAGAEMGALIEAALVADDFSGVEG